MTIPYLGPPAHTTPGSNRPVRRIVLHATVSPCVEGGARAVAHYFTQPNAGGSAHYIVDPGEVVRSAYDSVIAWHAPPNQGSIGIELCDPQKGDPARWDDAPHRAMLKRAARQVARLCHLHDVPPVRLHAADLLDGKHGVCGHVDVSRAWGQTDHTDPGSAFPWHAFMTLVHDDYRKLTPTPPAPRPEPEPPVIIVRPVKRYVRARPFDTLTTIARRRRRRGRKHGITVASLLDLNPRVPKPTRWVGALTRVRVR